MGWLPPSTDRNRADELPEPQSAPVGLLKEGWLAPLRCTVESLRPRSERFHWSDLRLSQAY